MEILFEKGIPGFESYNYFNVSAIEGNERFYNIVSKEDSNIGFVSISPFEIKTDYEIDLDDEFIKELDRIGCDNMLVISRKKGESLLIGDDIEITVEKIDTSSVKISIKAPKEKVILRKEVYEKVKDENSNAIATTKDILKILK